MSVQPSPQSSAYHIVEEWDVPSMLVEDLNAELMRLKLYPDGEFRDIAGRADLAMWGDCYNNLFPVGRLHELLNLLRMQPAPVEEVTIIGMVKLYDVSAQYPHIYYQDGEFHFRETPA